MKRTVHSIRQLLELVKFEHTLFALPFALVSMLLAAQRQPGGLQLRVLGWILVAMVGARSAAMSFNRLADAETDSRNPRTSGRHLPAGLLRPAQVWLFLALSIGLLELAAWQLNRLCFLLSPLALAAILGYSYSKRFTWLCHAWLGFATGLAPVGAWLAVRGRLELPAALLGLCVLLWIGGFDIIYALQDYEFDCVNAIFSLPKRVGKTQALAVSRLMHAGLVVLLAAVGLVCGLHWAYFAGVGVVAALIAYEQSIVRPDDLRRVNLAFFTLNGWVSMTLFAFVLIDRLVR